MHVQVPLLCRISRRIEHDTDVLSRILRRDRIHPQRHLVLAELHAKLVTGQTLQSFVPLDGWRWEGVGHSALHVKGHAILDGVVVLLVALYPRRY